MQQMIKDQFVEIVEKDVKVCHFNGTLKMQGGDYQELSIPSTANFLLLTLQKFKPWKMFSITRHLQGDQGGFMAMRARIYILAHGLKIVASSSRILR